MGEQPVGGAVQIAAIGGDDAGDIGDHVRMDLEVRMGRLQRLQPVSEDLRAQRLVEIADLDDEPAAESRADALIQRLQIIRHPVAGDDDLLAGVDQRVDRMAELLLDRLALDELHVVDDEKIDAAQLLLESQRGLRLQRRDEAVHETVGGEIGDALALAAGLLGDRLQEMRLAEPDTGMDVERVVGAAAGRGCSDAFRRGEGELVRLADDEGLEAHAPVEHGTAGINEITLGSLDLRHGDRSAFGFGGGGDRSRLAAAQGHDLGRRLRQIARHRAHREHDAVEARQFGHAVDPQPFGVMRLEPALQEAGGHRQISHAVDDAAELDAREPAREHVLAEFGAQAPPHPVPGLGRTRRRCPRLVRHHTRLLGHHHNAQRRHNLHRFVHPPPLEHRLPHFFSHARA